MNTKLYRGIAWGLACSAPFWLAVWLLVLAYYWVESPLPGWLQSAVLR